jgi:hypothetical protein
MKLKKRDSILFKESNTNLNFFKINRKEKKNLMIHLIFLRKKVNYRNLLIILYIYN